MYKIVNVPVLNMRKEPSCFSEMSSQALFSEEVNIISRFENWYEIETVLDGYKGFIHCREGDLVSKSSSPYNDKKSDFLYVDRLTAHVYRESDTIFGPILSLPYSCKLKIKGTNQNDLRWIEVFLPDASIGYIQSGDIKREESILDCHKICIMSLKFLGIPYTWGGRSSFGYDCSGFVQMLYKQMGLAIPRDSKDQFLSKYLIDIDPGDLNPGDLIFYGDKFKAIKHVGMSLGDNKFIHTSAVTENMPYVRISSLEDPAWNGTGFYPSIFAKTLLRV